MVIFILVLVLIYIKGKYVENMTVVEGNVDNMVGTDTVVGNGKQVNSNDHIKLGKITFNGNFNGRMAIDNQYFYDHLFDNISYFDNVYDYDSGDLITTGWDKCKIQCTGNCVAYGLTGATYCFPY